MHYVAGAAANAQAIAKAIKASGVIVRLEPGEFEKILARQPDLLVVTAPAGFLGKKHQYLTSYKGLAFHTVSGAPLRLPATVEIVIAQAIWIPT